MELYDNTVESFNEFIDLSFNNGRAEDGLLKNTYKYIYDGEDDERFIHLYLDFQNEIASQGSERTRFYVQHYLKEVYRTAVEQSKNLVHASLEQPEQTDERMYSEHHRDLQKNDKRMLSHGSDSRQEISQNLDKYNHQLKNGKSLTSASTKSTQQREEYDFEEFKKNEATLMGCTLVSSVIMEVLVGTQKVRTDKAQINKKEENIQKVQVYNLEEIEKNEATLIGCSFVSSVIMDVLAGKEKPRADKNDTKAKPDKEIKIKTKGLEEIEKSEAALMGCSLVSSLIMDVLTRPRKIGTNANKTDKKEQKIRKDKEYNLEEIEKKEATVMGCALASSVIMEVLVGNQKLRADKNNINMKQDKEAKIRTKDLEEIEKSEAALMGCSLVNSIIMEVLTGEKKKDAQFSAAPVMAVAKDKDKEHKSKRPENMKNEIEDNAIRETGYHPKDEEEQLKEVQSAKALASIRYNQQKIIIHGNISPKEDRIPSLVSVQTEHQGNNINLYSRFEQDPKKRVSNKHQTGERDKHASIEYENQIQGKNLRYSKSRNRDGAQVHESNSSLKTERSLRDSEDTKNSLLNEIGDAIPLNDRSAGSKRSQPRPAPLTNSVDISPPNNIQSRKNPSDGVSRTPKSSNVVIRLEDQVGDYISNKETRLIQASRMSIKPLTSRAKAENKQSNELYRTYSIGDINEPKHTNPIRESSIPSPKHVDLKPVRGSLVNRLQSIHRVEATKKSPRRTLHNYQDNSLLDNESFRSKSKTKPNEASPYKYQPRLSEYIPKTRQHQISVSDYRKKYMIKDKYDNRRSSQNPMSEGETSQEDLRPLTTRNKDGRDQNPDGMFLKTLNSKFPVSYNDKSEMSKKDKTKSTNPAQITLERSPIKPQFNKREPNAKDLQRQNDYGLNRTEVPNPTQSKQKKNTVEKTSATGKIDSKSPYNTKWFKKVLKNHYDVDLEHRKNNNLNADVRPKVKKIVYTRDSQRTREHSDDYVRIDDYQSHEYGYPPSSHQTSRNVDSNQRRGLSYEKRFSSQDSFEAGNNDRRQPAMRNNFQRSSSKDIKKIPSLHDGLN